MVVVQDVAVAILDEDAGQVLAGPRDQLDAHALGPQRVGGHVVDGVLEQLVVVLVVDGRADVREDLRARELAVGDVRVDRVVQQHLDVELGLGGEPLHKLEDGLVVQHEGDGVVQRGVGRGVERLLGRARRRVGGRGAQHVRVQLGGRLAVDAAAAVAREVLLLPRRVGRVHEHEPYIAVPRLYQLLHVTKLLEEEAAAEARQDERPATSRGEARHRLVEHHLHRRVPPVRVAEAPKLAPVAVALSQVRDGVVEEPVLEQLRAAAAHVGGLLAQLAVQLLHRVVLLVVDARQPLGEQLVRMEVERLQQALLERDRGAHVRVVLVPVLLARDQVDRPAPLRRVRRDAAELDEHGAHAHAQRQLELAKGDVPLEQRVHRRLAVGARGDRVGHDEPAVGLVELGVERPPVAEQPAVDHARLRQRRVEDLRRLVARERAVPHAQLRDVPLEVVLNLLPAVLGADQHGRHLVGELRSRARRGGEPPVDEEPHRRAVVRGHDLVPLVGRHGARRGQVPRVHLAVEERPQLR
eukprot:CAMPEP_0118837192 /NCGR_PEP_ID=MMETSP1162-20130426/61590_1 /TAXON_ID=33656 /ORGANISM="Phaeocystis Sp, Strain CCMP2710" /LENGTH=524 /DNA_ID=CAMNT_0006769061 /DNA_START=267 /DNA_END=1837 /DNA_ORIENTATION=+